MTESAEILKVGGNGAVVQLPGRSFPGIVIQGDSLSILVDEVKMIRQMILGETDRLEIAGELEGLLEKLQSKMDFYEDTLGEIGQELPYKKGKSAAESEIEPYEDRLDAWYDGSAICVIAKSRCGDPVDLSEDEAEELAAKIQIAIKSARHQQ